ncbi:TetR/AcrR family transcriptional regulator [Streptomonospora litoralis]|uniref:Tetracycline repressor protein class H n=1 Tax=Streptomonospora litoralis TaxID=2498135 RepID=A0A4V0ZJI3_9ACTN|nr:TetR/AcrR family transcriptional regulator [Streptomonospora litoralis]QBI53582.1 Tetracycline repressor protein class H [Streptomonospora litoralis]
MAAEERRGAPPKTHLTPAAVAQEALSLADSAGLQAVTIRRLAKELGVTPMALYWHFSSKDELLGAVAARVVEEIDLSVDASAAWYEQLRALLRAVLGAMRTHPAAAPLLANRTVASESGLRLTETALDVLGQAGFDPAEATQLARHALSSLANLVSGQPGVVTGEEPDGAADARRRARLFLESLSPERYPRLIGAAAPLSEGVDTETYFSFGLDLLLSGIEAMAARKG